MPKARIDGVHTIIYTRDADRDRAFIRDVLRLPSVDAGGGWLIFGLPPAEVAFHPADGNDRHELYLMTNDVAAFAADMASRGIDCSPPQSMGWGVLTSLTLPGGGKLGVYEPRHPRPPRTRVTTKARSPRAKPNAATRSTRSSAKARRRSSVSGKGERRRR
jgi:hypothetical protein